MHLGGFVFFLKIYLLILIFFFWLRWVSDPACGFSLVAVSRGYSSLHCKDVSLWWFLSLRSTGCGRGGFRSCSSWAVERRLSRCGTLA